MGKVLVIGGSGFVGTRLLGELKDGFEVANLDAQRSEAHRELTVVGDVRDRASLDQPLEGADAVVLLAAEHRDDVSPLSLYRDVNVDGMRNVLAAMDAQGVRRLVFTSTVAVYGLNKPRAPKEDDPLDPFNAYSESKLEAEREAEAWARKGEGREALILRPTVIFGENNRGNVYNLLHQIYTGKFLMIGDGRNRKSMAYVGNVAAFVRRKLERGIDGVEVFNYADKPDFDMNGLVEAIYRFRGKRPPRVRIPYPAGLLGGWAFDALAKLTGKKLPISSIRVRKFCASTEIDAGKLDASGFERPFEMRDALKRTLEHEFGDAR